MENKSEIEKLINDFKLGNTEIIKEEIVLMLLNYAKKNYPEGTMYIRKDNKWSNYICSTGKFEIGNNFSVWLQGGSWAVYSDGNWATIKKDNELTFEQRLMVAQYKIDNGDKNVFM